MRNITFFNKKKIKRKQFRKKINLLNKVFKVPTAMLLKKKIYKNLIFYEKYVVKYNNKINKTTHISKQPTLVSISQSKFNPKCTIYKYKNLNTFSVGSIIKYFKVKQSKYIRRSLKGLKIFLNFLKTILEKFYFRKGGDYMVFSISGVDYNLVSLKKNIKTLIKYDTMGNLLFLVNLKVSFTKKRQKKIKAIKKRLKKKIILSFIKSTI